MSEKTILLCCSFGVPFLAIALVIGGAGYVLRRVRPDLYMTDEEKAEAERKFAAEMAQDTQSDNDNNDKE